MKRRICLLLALILTLGAFPGMSAATRAAEPVSGVWAGECTYTWDADTRTLTIIGGMDVEFAMPEEPLFRDEAETIVVRDVKMVWTMKPIFEGYAVRTARFENCGAIEANAFVDCPALKTVILDQTTQRLLSSAIIDCDALTDVWLFNPGGYLDLFYDCVRSDHQTEVTYHYYQDSTASFLIENSLDLTKYRIRYIDPEEYPRPDVILPFEDVSENAYYAEAVNWATENHIVSGTASGVFSPKKTCTRAEIVTMLWYAMDRPEPVGRDNPFVDVAKEKYYYKPVLWAVQSGITSGTSANTFSPKKPCTRAEIVTFLWRAGCSQPGYAEDFDDVSDTAYYAEAVRWAVENGIASGTAPRTFRPKAPCTRAQAVTFLYKACRSYSLLLGAHNWETHEEVGHWLPRITCSCGRVFYNYEDWVEHAESYDSWEDMDRHAGYESHSDWIVEVPRYETCTHCGLIYYHSRPYWQ